MRRAFRVLLLLLGIPLLALLGLAGSIFVSFPPHQGPRVEGEGVVGIDAGGAYVWVVSTQDGVVLVDAGMSPEAMQPVVEEVADRTVHGILITHGHLDHIGGLSAFPEAPVFCGPGEAALIRGEVAATGLVQRLFASMMPGPGVPANSIRELDDGRVLTLDGAKFAAIHVPGHTDGSTMYRHGDLLFSGDSLLGHGDHVAPVHWSFSNDHAQSLASMERLTLLSFSRMADGHAGLHEGDLSAQLKAMLR